MKLIFTAVFLFMLWHTPTAYAQIFDAFRGHIQDIKSRLGAHQRMEGQVLKKGSIDTNAKGQDLIHNSSGSWMLVRSGDQLYLQSGEDFRSSCQARSKSEPLHGGLRARILSHYFS